MAEGGCQPPLGLVLLRAHETLVPLQISKFEPAKVSRCP
jgi:hypothetical protein